MELLSRLQSEFGEAVAPRAALDSDAVDGAAPQAVAAPRDEEVARQLVHFCGRENIAFVPRGGATKLHIGAPPQRLDLIISTEKLTQIFDHDEGNATVTAGAGISLWSLDEMMRKRGQFLSFAKADNRPTPTIGGVLATNDYGVKSRHGGVRDLVTGLHVVLSDGRLVKAGSKVVKNVSGYDLSKLFIGSYGTLGLITEMTVRLRPVVEKEMDWMQPYDSWQETQLQAWKICEGEFEPIWLYAYWNRNGCRIYGEFEGSSTTVGSQIGRLPESVESFSWAMKAQWTLRAHLPRRAAPLWAQLAQTGECNIEWDCLTGVIWARYETRPDIENLRAEAENLGGFLVVERAPAEVKTPELVWGKPRGDFALMRKLKQSYDAANVCAPGRFVGGL